MEQHLKSSGSGEWFYLGVYIILSQIKNSYICFHYAGQTDYFSASTIFQEAEHEYRASTDISLFSSSLPATIHEKCVINILNQSVLFLFILI